MMMTKNPNGVSGRFSCLATAAALATATLLAGCEMEPKPFDPINLQRIERARAHETENPGMRPLPLKFESDYMQPAKTPSTRPVFGAATRPSPTSQPVVRLTLQDIIHRAVANNHDVRVTGYDAAINQARVVEAEAQWDWKFFNQTQYQRQQNVQPSVSSPTLGTLQQGNTIDFKSLGFNTGFKTTTALGTELSLSENIQRFDRNGTPVQGLANPYWSNELTFQIKQPLLQNFGTEANTARLAIARNTQKGSLLDFRLQVEKQLFETEQVYWQLVQAEQDVKVREDLLARTRRTAQRFRDRLGTLGISAAELSLTNESVELRSVDLILRGAGGRSIVAVEAKDERPGDAGFVGHADPRGRPAHRTADQLRPRGADPNRPHLPRRTRPAAAQNRLGDDHRRGGEEQPAADVELHRVVRPPGGQQQFPRGHHLGGPRRLPRLLRRDRAGRFRSASARRTRSIVARRFSGCRRSSNTGS